MDDPQNVSASQPSWWDEVSRFRVVTITDRVWYGSISTWSQESRNEYSTPTGSGLSREFESSPRVWFKAYVKIVRNQIAFVSGYWGPVHFLVAWVHEVYDWKNWKFSKLGFKILWGICLLIAFLPGFSVNWFADISPLHLSQRVQGNHADVALPGRE